MNEGTWRNPRFEALMDLHNAQVALQRKWDERPWWRKLLGLAPKYKHRYFTWQ